jgi:hypothetical protein
MILSSLGIDDFTLTGDQSGAIERWNDLYPSLHCNDPQGVSRDLQIRTEVDFRELHFFVCALEARLFLITRDQHDHKPFYFGLELGLSPGNFDIYVYVTGDGKKPTGFYPLTAVGISELDPARSTFPAKEMPELRVLDIADYGPTVYFVPSAKLGNDQREFESVELKEEKTNEETATVRITIADRMMTVTVSLTHGTFPYRPLIGLFEAFGQTVPAFDRPQPMGTLSISGNSELAFVSSSLDNPIVVVKRNKNVAKANPSDSSAVTSQSSHSSPGRTRSRGGQTRRTSLKFSTPNPEPAAASKSGTQSNIHTLTLSPDHDIASFRTKIPKLTGEDVAKSPLIGVLHAQVLSHRMTIQVVVRENGQQYLDGSADPRFPTVVPLPAPVVGKDTLDDRTFYTFVAGTYFSEQCEKYWDALKTQENWDKIIPRDYPFAQGLGYVNTQARHLGGKHREYSLRLLREEPVGLMKVTNPIVERRFWELSAISAILFWTQSDIQNALGITPQVRVLDEDLTDVHGLDEFRARFHRIREIEPSTKATEENVRKEVFPVRQKHVRAVLAREANPLPIFPSYFIDQERNFFDGSSAIKDLEWSADSNSKNLPKYEIYRISRCCNISPTPDLVLKSLHVIVWTWVGDRFVIVIRILEKAFEIVRVPICSSTLDIVVGLNKIDGNFSDAIVNVEHRLLIFAFQNKEKAFLGRLHIDRMNLMPPQMLEQPIRKIVNISMNFFAIEFSRDSESWLEMWTIRESGEISMDPSSFWQLKVHPVFAVYLRSSKEERLFIDRDRLGQIQISGTVVQAQVVPTADQNPEETPPLLFGGGRIRSESVLQPTHVVGKAPIKTVEQFQVALIQFWPVLVAHDCGVAIPREKCVHLHRPGLEGFLLDGITHNCFRKYLRRLHFFGVENIGELEKIQCVLIVADDRSGAEYADWSFGTQFRLIEIPGVAVSIASVDDKQFVLVSFSEDAPLVLRVFGEVVKRKSALQGLLKKVQICARSQGKLDQLRGEILGQTWFEGRIDLRPRDGGTRNGFAESDGKTILLDVKKLIALWLTMRRLRHLPGSAVMRFCLEALGERITSQN